MSLRVSSPRRVRDFIDTPPDKGGILQRRQTWRIYVLSRGGLHEGQRLRSIIRHDVNIDAGRFG